MEEAEIPLDPPDGITDPVDRAQFWDRHASPISFLILGSLVAAAVTGHFGGQPSPRVDADFGLARLSVLTPTVIRNGEFFETAIDILEPQGKISFISKEGAATPKQDADDIV